MIDPNSRILAGNGVTETDLNGCARNLTDAMECASVFIRAPHDDEINATVTPRSQAHVDVQSLSSERRRTEIATGRPHGTWDQGRSSQVRARSGAEQPSREWL